ncbi:MAG: APC family permease [Acidimicrobiales bacterium]
MTTDGQLERRLGLSDAVVIGAGSMIGAGVFAAWGPAAAAAGTGLLIGLAIAGLVAFCNATSSAQLAAVHPESGGTYVYGRRQLGPFWGHLAGFGFVVGKTASCAAMAITVGAYLAPGNERLVAVAAVGLIVVVNLGGLTRTVAVTKVLLAVSLVALAAVVVSGWTSESADLGRLTPLEGDLAGILQSAGFLFFAFAGYARIATLGEEVRDPAVTIPKAIPRALGGVLVLYAVVGVTALAVVPAAVLGATDAPLRAVVEAGRFDALGPVVRVGAGIAALGVLLNLIPGVSRTALSMARQRELPAWFAHVDTARSLPLRAELSVAAVVVALVLVLDLRDAIGLSGVAVLTYYAITNASALTLDAEHRRWPRAVAVVGLVGCLVLVVALPLSAVVTGSAVLALGVVVRQVTMRVGAPPNDP